MVRAEQCIGRPHDASATAHAWGPAAAGCVPRFWPPEGRTAGRKVKLACQSVRATGPIDASKSKAKKKGGHGSDCAARPAMDA